MIHSLWLNTRLIGGTYRPETEILNLLEFADGPHLSTDIYAFLRDVTYILE